MRNIIFFMVAAISIFTLNSCQKGVESDNSLSTVYFNSFEAASDTTGWNFVSSCTLVNDKGGDYGTKSMHIAGGCVQPAASFSMSDIQSNSFKLGFWGKAGAENMSAGITFKFFNKGISKTLTIPVNSTQWQYYEAQIDTGINTTLSIGMEIFAGGIIANDMYLDNLRIEKI